LDENNSKDLDNEICEAALTSIENMIKKCSNEAKKSIDVIYNLTEKCLTYDPNYNYDDQSEEDQDMSDEEDGWGSDLYEDQQDDDDDTAWKIRKSAIKIIMSIIISCPV
jgi:cullin-associated NEDD8-dissociated protein 1